MRTRIALLGIFHESNTFLPSITSLKDFESGHLLYGNAIRDEYGQAFHEIGGMLERIEQSDMEPVPVMFAEATPSGIISPDTIQYLSEELSKAFMDMGPFDGILAVIHGAAVAEGFPDMDGWWLHKLRSIAGDSIPIIGTLDPHANVSEEMVEATTALVAYKTNPHIDQRETGAEAASLLVNTLRGRINPRQYLCKPPATISIEQQYTAGSPCRELYALAEQIRQESGILSVSVLLGFPYADVKEMGSSFIVVTNDDVALAQQSAEKLGNYFWKNRQRFVGAKRSVEETVSSLENHERPILLLDMGDNVGGGSPGDGTFILEALENAGRRKSFVCICDPESVMVAAQAGTGEKVSLNIGGKTDNRHGKTYPVQVTISRIAEGRFKETQPRHGGQVSFNMGTIAIVETSNETTIMLTSLRIAPFSLNQLTTFGIDPGAYAVIVAKGVHAPIAAYQQTCKSILQVNTHGITCADMTQLPFKNRRKPLYPFEIHLS